MKNPGFQLNFLRFVGAIFFALMVGLRAQPTPSAPGVSPSKAPRTKPQRIYQLRPASNYAATLHSQQKRTNNELPIDSNMPTSLQLSRSNANAAEAQPRQEATPQERHNPPPKVQRHRATHPTPVKSKGHGSKGHKH